MKNLIINEILYNEGENIKTFCETYNVTNDEFNKYFKCENNNIYIKNNIKCELIKMPNEWPQIKFDDELILDLALDEDEIKNYIK